MYTAQSRMYASALTWTRWMPEAWCLTEADSQQNNCIVPLAISLKTATTAIKLN